MKAIEIDDSLAEAHNALASILDYYDWKFAEAEEEWRKALELNPNYPTGRQWYGEHLMSMGRYSEALAEIRRAQELDPLSLIINGLLGVALRLNGRPEEALEQLRKTLEMDPNFARTHLFLAETYQSLARYEEAIDEFGKHFILSGLPPERVAVFAEQVKRSYTTDGPKGYARAMAGLIEKNEGPAGPPAVVLAGYLVRAGETDRAFAILEKAFQEHDDSLLMLKDGKLEPVKSDPRYRDLLRRVGLPE